MKIDEKALDIAVDVYCKVSDEDGDIRNAVHEILTAYEAAKWRPIEEAPRDGTELMLWNGRRCSVGYFERYGFNAGWRWLNGDFPAKLPVMFRTIDPPTKP